MVLRPGDEASTPTCATAATPASTARRRIASAPRRPRLRRRQAFLDDWLRGRARSSTSTSRSSSTSTGGSPARGSQPTCSASRPTTTTAAPSGARPSRSTSRRTAATRSPTRPACSTSSAASSADLRPRFWQTDTSVSKNSWGYITNQEYKDVDSIVDDLIDIVSKNGTLLLNIGPQPDGTIPEPEQEMLREIGALARRQRRGDLRHAALGGLRRGTDRGRGGPVHRHQAAALHRERRSLHDARRHALRDRAGVAGRREGRDPVAGQVTAGPEGRRPQRRARRLEGCAALASGRGRPPRRAAEGARQRAGLRVPDRRRAPARPRPAADRAQGFSSSFSVAPGSRTILRKPAWPSSSGRVSVKARMSTRRDSSSSSESRKSRGA